MGKVSGGVFFRLGPALALIGFTAVIAQIVLMRELMVVFQGNELALGLVLATWFLWTAIGSGALGRATARVRNSRALAASLQAISAFAFPLSILAARFSRSAIQSLPGEILGPGSILAISLAVLGPFCIMSGWLFTAGSRLYAGASGSATAASTSSIYLLEAIGSGAGGILASLVLIRYLSPFEIAALLSLLNLLSASMLFLRTPSGRGVAAAFLVIFAAMAFPSGAHRLEDWSLRAFWRGFSLLAARNSFYGNLAVIGTRGNRSLCENGLVMATSPDPEAAEEAVHYALLQHPLPRRLLLIGGGVNGSLAQALQHPSLARIDYVELDPSILDLARMYFAAEWQAAEADPRVHTHNIDGRLFVKKAPLEFDVVIVNLPDPQTAQLNRFYTVEFFEEVRRKLGPGGVFSFRLAGAENYISPGLAEFLRCINKTLRQVFQDVVAIPGDPVHFFASPRANSLTADPARFVARLHERQLQTSYVREYYLPFRMTPDRMADLEAQIRPLPETAINRDFAPIAYYFDIVLWSGRFASARHPWLPSLARARFPYVVLGLMGVLLLVAIGIRRFGRGRGRQRASAGFCVSAMGFTMIALEVVLLLGFQSLYGHVYRQLAIVTAGFMTGMALGSWRGLKPRDAAAGFVAGDKDLRSLAALQGIAAFSPILLVLLFIPLARFLDSGSLWMAGQVMFPLFALGCGFLGGFQFPLASRIYFPDSGRATAGVGALYALDLAGSCLGAVLLSICLVPVFGFLKSALLIGLANLVPAASAWLARSDADPAC